MWCLAAGSGGEVRPHFIPGNGFPSGKDLCPTLVSHPMEVIVQLSLLNGLGYGVDNEAVRGLAGTFSRRRNTRL